MAQEAAADHHRRQIRLQHQRLAERLHHDHGLDRAGAKAAIGFRERQAQQALLGELAPDGLAPAALLLLVLLARIEIVGIGQQTVDAFLEKALLLGQIKIHVRYFLQITKFSPSCPGLSRASTSCFPCAKTWMAEPLIFSTEDAGLGLPLPCLPSSATTRSCVSSSAFSSISQAASFSRKPWSSITGLPFCSTLEARSLMRRSRSLETPTRAMPVRSLPSRNFA